MGRGLIALGLVLATIAFVGFQVLSGTPPRTPTPDETPAAAPAPPRPAQAGMGLSGGATLLQEVKAGSTARFAPIRLRNPAVTARTFHLAIRPVAVMDLGIPFFGYRPIPDLGLVGLAPGRVEVPPGASMDVDLLVRIPEGREQVNRHWEFVLEIAGLPQGQETLAARSLHRFHVETETRDWGENGEAPASWVVAPTRLRWAEALPGRRCTANVWIHHDAAAAEPRVFRLRAVVPPPAAREQFTPISPGFEPLPDVGGILVDGRTGLVERTLAPGERASIEVGMTPPATPGGRWEAFLSVLPVGESAEFVRLQVEVGG